MRHWTTLLYVMLGLGALAGEAQARHLQLREAMPASGATVSAENSDYVLRFDGTVDHDASRIEIIGDGKVLRTLHPLLDSAADVLFATGERLPAGHYELWFQTRSLPEGEVTEGAFPFSVAQ